MTLRHQSGLLGAALAFALSSAAARAQDIVKQDLTEIEVVGSTALDDGQIVPVPTDVNEKRKDLSALTQLPQSDAADMVAAPLTTPFAATTPFARREGARGFDGLNHFDQRNAGTGPYANSQFSLEPPDQALCVGNGFVVEAVNTALAVYSEGGRRLKGPTALNQFFGAKPEINRTTGVRGDFLSDPKCLFDRDTNRFFVTVLTISQKPSGGFAAPTKLLIAVSNSGNPTGTWTVYAINTTNHASVASSFCPCFGDQPLIGSDRNGFFISTNAFRLAGGFVGVQIYALNKRALASGAGIGGVRFAFPPRGAGAFTIQPALLNSADRDDGPKNTEFFASIANIRRFFGNQLVVWAMTGTNTLGTTNDVTLSGSFVDTQVYGVPPDAQQQGTPYGNSVGQGLELLATNEHRLQQVQASEGRLYTALTTVLRSPGDTTGATDRAGIAWFVLRPTVDAVGKVAGTVENQGYIAADGNNNLFYPSFVSNGRNATIGFALSGPGHFAQRSLREDRAGRRDQRPHRTARVAAGRRLHRLRGHVRTLGRLFGRRGRARRQPVDGDRGDHRRPAHAVRQLGDLRPSRRRRRERRRLGPNSRRTSPMRRARRSSRQAGRSFLPARASPRRCAWGRPGWVARTPASRLASEPGSIGETNVL